MSTIAHSVLEFIEVRDHRLMRRVHRWRAPRWIRLWMICATRGGDGWLWYLLGAALLLFGGETGMRTVVQSTSAAATGIALFLWLKRAAGRKRPCALEPHCWAQLLPPDQFSFPSGHTITAFAIAIPVVAQYPVLAPELWFLAMSVAVSRIVLGMHFLSDVVAGAIVGCLLGRIAMALL
ncbi:MAG: phosphatase PAP2 family protein [Bryobacterales bacterium]|nr:phosphatase PAP2 family protein [Bryobacterales bacterium]